jgi:2,3-bisphosphoglycerate-independent phosphoglycerate mutase
VMGRYYAMDRDKRWDRVKKAYDAVVLGKGDPVESAEAAVQKNYAAKITDEFVLPAVVQKNGRPVGRLRDKDAVIFFNFRADRARQLTRAMTQKEFSEFPRERIPELSSFVTMTSYDETFTLPVAFGPIRLKNILGEVVSRLGLRQLRIAETEKYAHVTYFFNGGNEKVYPGEDRVLIPSPKEVATYDQKPEMSAPEVTAEVVRRIEQGIYDFVVLNYANPDMVGHSGNLPAAVAAAETIDRCLERVATAALNAGGAVLLTADHGNLEQMIDYETGEPHTAHTTNPVPLILISNRTDIRLKSGGIHADISPTILDLMEIAKPEEMDRTSLIVHEQTR